MNIAGAVLIFAGLILLLLLPRLRPSKPPLRLGLASKLCSEPHVAHEETRESENRDRAGQAA
jgi:hypothetical protein